MATQKVFGPDQRNGKWYFVAYVEGQQAEWGPYHSEAFAQGALKAITRRINGDPAKEPSLPAEDVAGPAAGP